MKTRNRINKIVVTFLMISISLMSAFGITYLYAKSVIWFTEEKNSTITIQPSNSKNINSWGNELRFYYIMVNGDLVDLSKIDMKEGWSYDGTFLFFNGQGSELVINNDQPIKNLTIRYCKQCGSGIADVYINNNKVQSIDLYDKEWVQADYVEELVKKSDVLLFGITASIIIFFLLYIVLSEYHRKDKEANRQSVDNTIAMFDYAKGIGILLVILYHTINFFDMMQGSLVLQRGSVIAIPKTLLVLGLMPAFLIASGYSFKKKTVKKCIISLSKLILIPYVYVMIIVSGITLIKSFVNQDSLLDTLKNTTLPFLIDALKIGPMWFLIALYLGTIVFNFILQIRISVVHHISAILIFILGIIALNFAWIPSIVYFTFTAVGYIYVGYLLKKTKWLINRDWQSKAIISLLVIISVLSAVAYNYLEQLPELALVIYEEILKLISGFVLIYGSIGLNKFKGNISNLIRQVGRYSLWILCIHSIEYLCIPWFELTNIFGYNPILVTAISLILRYIICFLGCYLIYLVKRKKMRVQSHFSNKMINSKIKNISEEN